MNTDSQPKKLLSRKRLLQKIKENDLNPFERVDGKLLEKVAKEINKQQPNEYEEALL